MSHINTWADVRKEVINLVCEGVGYLIGLAFFGLCIAVPIVVVGGVLNWVMGYC